MSTLLLLLMTSITCPAGQYTYDGGEIAREIRAIRRVLYPSNNSPVSWEKEVLKKLGDRVHGKPSVSEIRQLRMELERLAISRTSKARVGGATYRQPGNTTKKTKTKLQGAKGL